VIGVKEALLSACACAMQPAMSIDNVIHSAAVAIRESGALLITAGAGIGVDSGLPDFRGPEGFWKAYPPYRKLGLHFAQLASPSHFARDPHLAWGFYGHRLNLYRNTRPHAGFAQLREWALAKPGGFFIFTSNVDGQFTIAGFPPDRILECHGSIHHLQCSQPCDESIWPADAIDVKVDLETMQAIEPLPHCPRCGSIARPNILMFGDSQWLPHRTDAIETVYRVWCRQISSARLCIIECGAGIAVPTVRHESEQMARRFSGTLIRINLRDQLVPDGGISIPLPAAEAISKIAAAM
jgi:NAD-dependent SIR2 family protein deacetylase